MESQPVRDVTPNLTDDSDADLLVYMTMAESDPACAQTAWEIFYERHVGYLYRVCFRAYGDILGGEAGVLDLVAEVFRTVYQNAHKFDPAGISDPQRLRLRTRGWLGWIARRMVQDMLRSRGRLPMRSLELDHWQQISEANNISAGNSPMQQAVRRAIESLSEREQIVIRTTFQWYRPEKDHQRLPNEVTADLAETLGTTPENLRQIRRRAMKKIAEFVQAHAAANGKKETSHE